MNSEVGDEKYFNVTETAEMLQVHENTIRNWAKNGVLKSSKLPGARGHRFAQSEVERMKADRGKTTSSVAKPLRQDGPELVNHIDLDAWAARDDAKTAFPELMDRLLQATSGVSNVNVRSHEGTAAHGWDGTATSRGSSPFPEGPLYFEFGTSADPEKKANDDYANRRGTLSDPGSATFVFATPKDWPHGTTWATEKQAFEHEYAGIEVFDAQRLASWIRLAPSVHYWLSERLGYSPHDAQTLDTWWANFIDGLTLELPGDFFVAGRKQASKAVVDRLTAAIPEVLTIRASDETEALAFLYGALEQSELLQSVLIVNDDKAWVRLAESTGTLVLIPTFDSPQIAKASKHGHRVVLLARTTEPASAGSVSLPRIDPIHASEAIRKTMKNFNESQKLVSLARRNMPAFLRSISHDARFRAPHWATDSAYTDWLARLVLFSTWSSAEADRDLIANVTEKSWREIDRSLKALVSVGSPAYVSSGDSWQLAAPKEAAKLLFPHLVFDDVKRWKEMVGEVLLSPDPYLGMNGAERFEAQIKGVRPQYSAELRRGVALSLALAGWFDEPVHGLGSLSQIVNDIARAVYEKAASDDTGTVWASISDVLPLLAEAAPTVFLDAVESDLDQNDPVLRTLFRDEASDNLFGPSSPHTGLLWALECLCWSPEYFHRAAGALAQLARLDPGGKLSNRPSGSFHNVMIGWIRQSGATVDEKIVLLETLVNSVPDTMWPLVVGLLPEAHGFSIPPFGPTYRDWSAEPSNVLMSDLVRYIKGILQLARLMALGNPERWAELLEKCDDLPISDRAELLQSVVDDRSATSWTNEDKYTIWRTLDEKIRRHEEFPTADWSLPDAELGKLREIRAAFASSNDPRSHQALFDWRARYQGMSYGDPGFEEALTKAQNDALTDVAKDGIDALKSLTQSVKNTQAVGWQLALIDDASRFDEDLIGWLDNSDVALLDAGRAFVRSRIYNQGWEWVKRNYRQVERLSDNAKRLFAMGVPFSHEYWSKLDEDTPALVDEYWAQGHFYLTDADEYQEAVDRLLAAGHPWAAVAVISNYMHPGDKSPELETVKKALSSLIETSEPMTDTSMSPYYVEQLLGFMEQHTPDDVDLPRYEFALFGLLHDKNPTLALYRELNNSPEDFIAMVQLLFRAEGAEKRESTAATKRLANRYWDILREWKTLPGQGDDGKIDLEKLQEWVRGARFAFEESGHTSIGDEKIGEILSASPSGADGLWPAEAVREIIEATASVRLETGIEIGLYNRRGATTRSPYEGGTQERSLQNRYQEMSLALAPKWRRTSRVLAAIAESYARDARREDAQAERQADQD